MDLCSVLCSPPASHQGSKREESLRHTGPSFITVSMAEQEASKNRSQFPASGHRSFFVVLQTSKRKSFLKMYRAMVQKSESE